MSILECVERGCAQKRNSKTLYVCVSFLGQQVGSIREAGHWVLSALIFLLSHADPSIFKKPQAFVTPLLSLPEACTFSFFELIYSRRNLVHEKDL